VDEFMEIVRDFNEVNNKINQLEEVISNE